MTKMYDPLWEIVGEQLPLQGAVQDIDALCPVCHVKLHIGSTAEQGQRVECGLCSAPLVVDTSHVRPSLVEATED